MIFIDWNDVTVSRRLADGDVITATDSDLGDSAFTEFVLELAPHKDWWKGIQVLDNTNAQIGFIELHGRDSTPTEPLRVPSVDIDVGGKLILWKAKMFGVHTPMYVLTDLEQKKGKRVQFRWSSD